MLLVLLLVEAHEARTVLLAVSRGKSQRKPAVIGWAALRFSDWMTFMGRWQRSAPWELREAATWGRGGERCGAEVDGFLCALLQRS